jgi:hypothetical protein
VRSRGSAFPAARGAAPGTCPPARAESPGLGAFQDRSGQPCLADTRLSCEQQDPAAPGRCGMDCRIGALELLLPADEGGQLQRRVAVDLLHVRDEPDSPAAKGPDHVLPASVVTQRPAEVAQRRRDRHVAHAALGPHLPQELPSGDRAIPMASQVGQQLQWLPGQIERLPAPPKLRAVQVELEITKRQDHLVPARSPGYTRLRTRHVVDFPGSPPVASGAWRQSSQEGGRPCEPRTWRC